MSNSKETNQDFQALVKFEISAAHFSGAYEFCHFSREAPAEVAASIWDEFLSRVVEARAYLDDAEKEETSDEWEDLAVQAQAHVEKAMAGDLKSVADMAGYISVGYPAYSFEVMASGYPGDFTSACLAALESDSDVAGFIECWEEVRSDERSKAADTRDSESVLRRELAMELRMLFETAPARVSEKRLSSCLAQVEELIIEESTA